MAIKWLDAKRLQGTNAERTGMTGIPAARTPNFEDNFINADEWTQKPDSSPNADWFISDGFMNISIIRDNNPTPSTRNNNFTHDLEDELGSGNTVSDTWVWRFRFELTAYTNAANNSGYPGGITICNQPANVSSATSGYYGIQFFTMTGQTLENPPAGGSSARIGTTGKEYAVSYFENQTVLGGNSSGQWTALTTAASVDQVFYVEIIRNSLTLVTCNIYSNDTYTTLTETKTIAIPSTFSNRDLRYIRAFTGGDDMSGGSVLKYKIDDMEFYDNATSTDTTPNLPNGTIFNETDTYKYFMFDGTDTWNQMVSS